MLNTEQTKTSLIDFILKSEREQAKVPAAGNPYLQKIEANR